MLYPLPPELPHYLHSLSQLPLMPPQIFLLQPALHTDNFHFPAGSLHTRSTHLMLFCLTLLHIPLHQCLSFHQQVVFQSNLFHHCFRYSDLHQLPVSLPEVCNLLQNQFLFHLFQEPQISGLPESMLYRLTELHQILQRYCSRSRFPVH